MLDQLHTHNYSMYGADITGSNDRNLSTVVSMGDGWYTVTRERLVHAEAVVYRTHWNVPVLVNGYSFAHQTAKDYCTHV